MGTSVDVSNQQRMAYKGQTRFPDAYIHYTDMKPRECVCTARRSQCHINKHGSEAHTPSLPQLSPWSQERKIHMQKPKSSDSKTYHVFCKRETAIVAGPCIYAQGPSWASDRWSSVSNLSASRACVGVTTSACKWWRRYCFCSFLQLTMSPATFEPS